MLPSAEVVDSRLLRSALSAWARDIDGDTLIKRVKLGVTCDKHSLLLELHPANTDDCTGTLPMLP